MKKATFILFILLVAAAPRIYAQNAPISTIGNIASTGTSVILPITVINFNDIGSAYLTLHYDPTIMTATEVTTGPPLFGTGLNYNISTPGLIIISWYTSPGISIPDNSVVFNLNFTKVSSGISPVTWDTDDYSNIYFSGFSAFLNDSPFSNFYFPGSVTFQNYAPTTVAPNIAACPGTNISVPVIVNNFNNIGAISLRLDYNTSALTYISSINNAGFPLSIDGTTTSGSVFFGGYSSNPIGITYPDNTTLVTLNFTYLGGSTGLNWIDNGTSCEFTGPNYEPTLIDIPQSTYYIDGQVSQYPTPTLVSSTATDALCFGGNGTINIEYTGGTGTLNYTIGAETNTTGTFTRPAGTYTYSVSDASGCPPVTGTVTVEAPPAIVFTATPAQPLCFGQTGSVTLEVSGGTAPYTYDPLNPATTGLAAGSYTYQLTDANGCPASATAIISAAPPAIIFTATPAQPLCFGQTGSVTLEVPGGTAPYTYDPLNPATTGLAAGSYTYQLTDANGCPASATAIISAAPPAIVFTATPAQPLCFGQTGSVTLEVSGGTAPYTYDPLNPATTGLAAGSYTYQLTDANGCPASATAIISAAPPAIIFTATPVQPLCFGETGSVTLEVSGGTAPYTYDPLNPATTGLSADSYTYQLTDANGCPASATAIISAAPPAIVFTATPVQPLCFGQTGSVTLEVSGGTAPYTYDPLNPATTGLAAGSYTYQLTDANGCPASATAIISAAPPAIIFTATPAQPLCFGQTGSVTLEVSGGTAPYTYDPLNPATTGLAAGSYTYQLTDANGCPASATAIISAAPPAIIFTATPVQPLCFGQTGSVTLEVSGGTAPYTYDPLNPATTGLAAGSYTYQLTDANGCPASATAIISAAPPAIIFTATPAQPLCFGQTGSVTLEVSGGTAPYTYDPLNPATTGLATGSYTYNLTDANGCPASATAIISAAPPAIIFTATPVQPLCFGQTGSVTLEVSGGTAPYTYDPLNPATTGLAAGSYTYQLTDANGCPASATAIISAAPPAIVFTATPVQPLCFGQTGSVTLEVSGGTAPYTYDPLNPATTGLAAGSYTYQLTDANGCPASATAIISAAPPAITLLSATVVDPPYWGENGTITIVCNGGTGTLYYTIGPETNTTGVFARPAGVWEYSVTDANNCGPLTGSVTISEAETRLLSMKLYLQGLFDISNNTMNSPIGEGPDGNSDYITIELRNASDYSVVEYTAADVFIKTDGTINVAIPASYSESYYLSVYHRNSVNTVSASPVSFTNGIISYDFSDGSSKAYGNNMVEVADGIWAFFAGDVNQDGIVDIFDLNLVDNDSGDFMTGYVTSDINGDGVVNSADISIVYSNSSLFVTSSKP